MNLAAWILKRAGWTLNITAPNYPKCLICVAPHTSNWDFILGKLAYAAVGRHAGFMMKEQWFFWPLGCLFRAIGGIAVPRRNNRSSLTETVVHKFNNSTYLQLAITPEGTRSLNPKWHTGFLRIAYQANIPIEIGIIDYKLKCITIQDVFHPTGDIEADLEVVKNYYKNASGRYPEKFTITDS